MEITLDIGYPSNLLYSDVSISVPDHGIISFVGDNGCGKSTLLKTLAGIINPMRGVVPSELLNMNFMVSNYISIPEEVKVKDIMLLLGNENCNYVKNKYGNIYQFVEKLERQTVKKLSSGEKKVVEIFSSLALHKKYLLLDEASNALDITNRQFLLDALISVSQKDIVVFYVSHNLNEIIKLNGEVYCFIPKFKTIKKIQNEEMERFLSVAQTIFEKLALYETQSPACKEVQQIVQAWRDYISEHFYSCNKETLSYLGQLYISDERFSSYINRFGCGNLANFFNEAIKIYCTLSEG